MKANYGPEIRKKAQDLYVVEGYTVDEIAELDDMPSARSIRRWAEAGKWEDMCPSYNAEMAFSKRINVLADKEDKTDADYKELDFCTRQLCALNKSKLAPAPKQRASNDDAGNNNGGGSNKKSKKKKKNDCSGITVDMLNELKDKLLYPHQKHWFENQDYRSRFILKPRQIGATFYFAFEAFYDAVVNGRNKIFISASRDQAEVFKANIVALCREHFNIELTGSPMVLNLAGGKTVKLIFKSTNARTAQSESGDLYIDEVFWIPNYKTLRGLAQAMATHKHLRITYFSTPSVTSHEAYDHWNGKWYRKTKACNDPEFAIDVSHKNLKHGQLCDDGIWRQMLTVHDVVKSGFDRIDIEVLENEYSTDEFNNLFMCKFIDDAHSAFNLKQIMACVGDSKASVAVLSAPMKPGEKFRLLEAVDLSGNDFEAMASEIKLLTEKYNVQHIGVDTTGIGYGVWEMITKFYPNAEPIHYNPIIKNQLVIKAINVIKNRRFEFDQDAVNIASSFINIRRKVVGDQITYATNRTATTGHADIAWAIMHAMKFEPLDGNAHSRQTSVGIAA